MSEQENKALNERFFAQVFNAHNVDEIDEMVASGDRVAIRSTFTGTHEGEFLGVPPTGKSVSVDGIDIVRVVDGRATDHWGIFDAMGMMQQLGVMPAPGAEQPTS